MRARLAWAVAGTAVLLSKGAVRAEPALGDRGQLALSAERLFGYLHTKQTVSAAGVERSQSQDTITLLTGPLGAATGYTWPRIGFDGFIASNISIGGAVGFFHLEPDSGSLTGFQLAPRAGYLAPLSSQVAIWLRAGFTYEHLSFDTGSGVTTSTRTTSVFALTVEAPVAIQVAPRIVILVSPTLDLGLTGSQSSGGSSIDTTFTDFGLQAGLLVLL